VVPTLQEDLVDYQEQEVQVELYYQLQVQVMFIKQQTVPLVMKFQVFQHMKLVLEQVE